MDRISIRDAFESPRVFAGAFAGRSWRPWFVALSLLYGLPVTGEDAELAFKATGRRVFPTGGFNEAYFAVGRGGGKSRAAAALAVYQAVFAADWPVLLAAGERAKVLVLACDREQARIVWNYCHGLLHSNPLLEALIESESATVIQLTNRTDIEVATSSFRSIRGRTVVCAILEEISFWRSDESSKNPAGEIIRALKPALMRQPGSKMVAVSSAYSREGVLWEAIQKHHGRDDADVLAWVSDSLTMNPTLDPVMIQREIDADPEAANAEWMSIFRSDISSFIDEALLAAAVVPGRRTDLPLPFRAAPVAFADPSGGRSDSFTAAVAMADAKGKVTVLAVREVRPPFDPQTAVMELARWLQGYGITEVVEDRYAGEWVSSEWAKQGIRSKPSDLTASEIYLELLPLMAAGKVELPDLPRMVTQFRSLERRVRPGGRDQVTHPPGIFNHDDIANAVAGASVLAAQSAAAGDGQAFGFIDRDIRPADVNPDPSAGGYRGGDALEMAMFNAAFKVGRR